MSTVVFVDDTTVYEPSAEEVREYAEFLGIDLSKEKHLEWIAREGLCAPVSPPWKVCTDNSNELFYFNSETGESVWDHPCDEKYRNMVKEYRKKRNTRLFLPSPAMESKLENMWCDGIKSDKPTYDEIQSRVEAKCNVRPQVCLVPRAFPGFLQKVFDYADVTQKDIDNAWLAAALDVLGRPALQLSHYEDSLGYSRRDSDLEPSGFHMDVESDDQRMLSMSFHYRTAAPPTSFFGVDLFDLDDASPGFLDSVPDGSGSPHSTQDDDQFFLTRSPGP